MKRGATRAVEVRRGVARRCFRLCLSLIVLCLLPSQALAGPLRSARFSVKVEGTQTSEGTLAGVECPTGTSLDTVKFVSAPVRIRLIATGPFLEMTGLSRGGEDDRQPFTISGTVTRSNSGEFSCLDERAGKARDCGTKPFHGLSMLLQSSSANSRKVRLDVSLRAEDPPDVFTGCTAPGFPLVSDLDGTPASLAAAAVFDRSRATIVLPATRSRKAEGGFGASVEKTVKLRLVLRRL